MSPFQLSPVSSALSEAFLSPLGLAALLALVPLVVLYLLQSDPDRLELPTVRFLLEERDRDRRVPGVRRLRRTALLLVQALVIAALAVSLASPYVAVPQEQTVSETVLVVDASASMATETGGGTRFSAATAAARDEVTARTSIVVAGADTWIALRRGPPTEARRTVDAVAVEGAAGDLRAAVERATALAGESARIVVLSDFAGAGDWRRAVRVARARGHPVDLRQFDGGDRDNVGVVDVALDDGEAAATVRNFGTEPASRTLSLGDRSTTVQLEPGDVATRALPVPTGGGTLRLSPGDSFPLDDEVPVAAPGDPTIEVLLLTNGGNEALATALSVVDAVELTVERPPAAVDGEYDVVVFGAVDPGQVLDGSVAVARETLEAGGGVVVQARPNVSAAGYGDLLPVEPRGVERNGTVTDAASSPLTRGVDFPDPGRYLAAGGADGRVLVETADGSPLLVRDTVASGRVLYYGYFDDRSAFAYSYRYPVFWKRVVYDLAGRPSLETLNRQTGGTLSVDDGATVTTPRGDRAGPSVRLRSVGVYEVDDRRYAAALLDPGESNVTAGPVEADDPVVGGDRVERRTVPRDLTPLAVAAAALFVLLELGLLRRRGDL